MDETKSVDVKVNVETESVSLAKSPTPPQKIILADGKEYELTILNLNILGELQEAFALPLDELWELLKKPKEGEEKKKVKLTVKQIRKIMWASLREKYPEMSEEDFGKLMTIDVISDGAIQKIFGYVFQSKTEEEKK